LFLTRRGTVKVLDFGLAKIQKSYQAAAAYNADETPTAETFVTLPGTVLGTLAYMAPEQVRGETVDGRADLYAVGVVLFEMLTGRLPVRGSPAKDLPEGLAPVVMKLLALDRDQRYRDAAEARAALELGLENRSK
jgi:serine/threonine protein kinase